MLSRRSRRGGGRGFPPTLIRGFKGGEIQRGYAQAIECLVSDGPNNMGLAVRPGFYRAQRQCGAHRRLAITHLVTEAVARRRNRAGISLSSRWEISNDANAGRLSAWSRAESNNEGRRARREPTLVQRQGDASGGPPDASAQGASRFTRVGPGIQSPFCDSLNNRRAHAFSNRACTDRMAFKASFAPPSDLCSHREMTPTFHSTSTHVEVELPGDIPREPPEGAKDEHESEDQADSVR